MSNYIINFYENMQLFLTNIETFTKTTLLKIKEESLKKNNLNSRSVKNNQKKSVKILSVQKRPIYHYKMTRSKRSNYSKESKENFDNSTINIILPKNTFNNESSINILVSK